MTNKVIIYFNGNRLEAALVDGEGFERLVVAKHPGIHLDIHPARDVLVKALAFVDGQIDAAERAKVAK